MITKYQASMTIGFTLAVFLGSRMIGDRLNSTASRLFADTAPELEQSAGSDRSGERLNSDGAMYGVNLRHARVYDAQGLQEPKSVLWKTTKLFTGKGQTYPVASNIITANKEAYFGGYGYLLYVIDLQTGETKNRFKLDKAYYSLPVAAGALLFLGADDGTFYAFDRRDWKARWQINKEGYSFLVGSSAVANGIIYFGSAELISFVGDEVKYSRKMPKASVHAVDALTGTQKWMFTIKGYPTPIAVADEVIYFGDGDRHLFAVNAKDGQEIWKFTASGNIGPPAIMDERAFFNDDDGNLYAVELKRGQAIWKAAKQNKVNTALAAYNKMIYYGGRKNSLYAVDALMGQEKWVYPTTKSCLAPVAANGAIYVACQDKTLLALDAGSGQEKWKYKTPYSPITPPVVGNGIIYYLDEEGIMYALGSS
jgi:outer membrane protein assembly factor BamB